MATKTFDAPYVPITTVNPSSSRRIEYTYFIYPLEKSKKHLQKWFTGEYLYITDVISTYIVYCNITWFLICKMTRNLYFYIYKKPIDIKQMNEFESIHYIFTYPSISISNKIHITKLFKFKNFDKNLIPENIKRLIVETL